MVNVPGNVKRERATRERERATRERGRKRVKRTGNTCGSVRISFKLGIAWTVTRKRFTGTKTGNANGQRVPNCAKQQKTGLRVDGNAKTANGGKNVERVR